jgi:hypothetical protein
MLTTDQGGDRVNNRYSIRKVESGYVTLAVNGLIGQGQLVNLSVPGCLIETTMPLAAGYFMQLRIPVGKHHIRVELAAVRWVNETTAGVEFIRMSEEDQARLCRHVGFVPRRIRTTQWSERVEWSGLSGD